MLSPLNNRISKFLQCFLLGVDSDCRKYRSRKVVTKQQNGILIRRSQVAKPK